MSAPSRRDLVRYLIDKGLSERRSLHFVDMSPSSFRYRPATDRNAALKEKIVTLAQHHWRYGAGMSYLKLQQAGMVVNHKRVDRARFFLRRSSSACAKNALASRRISLAIEELARSIPIDAIIMAGSF